MEGNWILLALVLFPMGAALIGYLIGRKSKAARDVFVMACGLAEFACLLAVAVSTVGQTLSFRWNGICSMGIRLMLDDFRRVYGLVAAFMWAMTLLFSREYFAHYRNRNRYYFFNLLTLGATLGVFLSTDLYTTLIFFEIMSFTSYVWVAHEETEGAMRAANTYLAVAVIGGLSALMGLFLLHHTLGTLEISRLYEAAQAYGGSRGVLYTAGICILIGFGAKAGMFPLHIWLPKAHPVAPAPASALLSGILTKSGVFGILAVSCNLFRYDPSWGRLILILGVITMVLGAVLALFSVDLKRTLACSSMSQIGFIAVGIGCMGLLGVENALAARGVVLHMMNHSLIKLVLFMAAGVIYMNLHQLNLNDIRGFGRKKPILNFCFLMGALGIGGIPLWNGYVSKTLLHEGIVELTELISEAGGSIVGIKAAEWLFLFSGGLTLAYMTKLYIAIFVEKHPTRQAEFDAKKRYMNPVSTAALTISAILLPVLGMTANATMNGVADLSKEFFATELPHHAVHYLSLENLKGAGISIAVGAAVYFGVVRTVLRKKVGDTAGYVNLWPAKLDLEDLLYRPLLLKWLPGLFGRIMAVFGENQVFTPLFRWGLKGVGALTEGISVLPEKTAVCLKAAGAATRAVSELPDAALVGLRWTIFREAKEAETNPVKRRLDYKLGRALDKASPPKEGEEARSLRFVRKDVSRRQTARLIRDNMSFALLMCAVGLCLLLLYLVFVYGS